MSTLTQALAPKSDQLNADDLIPGPRTIKITGARIGKDERQLRITLSFEGDNGKPFKPCKTMARAMVLVWGITDENFAEQFVGKSIRVYRDPEVKFGDQGAVGGIRISHMSHIDSAKTVKLTVSQGKKANFVFQPLPTLAATGGNADAAANWANGYIAKLETFGDLAAVEAHETARAAKLAELGQKRPELHKLVIEALAVRKAALADDWSDDTHQPPTDASPRADADPSNDETDAGAVSQEGRSDVEHGDQFDGSVTLESAKARQDSAKSFETAKNRYNEDVQFLNDEDAIALGEYHQARIQTLRGA